jgi:Asp-tRNA(Asn)/Glu-tRNA(Gln) amidotransferase A subunit family amidase
MLLFSYTCIWNVLGMTAGSIPITIVREDEQYYNSKYNDDISDAIKSSVKDSAGLPNGIQVIGLPYDEEKVLGLMKQIENHFNFLSKHPFPDL